MRRQPHRPRLGSGRSKEDPLSGVPDHLRSVTPSLVVTPCAEAIEFYEKAFGAVEAGARMTGPDGSVGHAEIRIGDSVIMLGDEWPDGPVQSPTTLGGTSAALFIYTDDVDALWRQAINAEAEVVFPLEIQFSQQVRSCAGPVGAASVSPKVEEHGADKEMKRAMSAFYEAE